MSRRNGASVGGLARRHIPPNAPNTSHGAGKAQTPRLTRHVWHCTTAPSTSTIETSCTRHHGCVAASAASSSVPTDGDNGATTQYGRPSRPATSLNRTTTSPTLHATATASDVRHLSLRHPMHFTVPRCHNTPLPTRPRSGGPFTFCLHVLQSKPPLNDGTRSAGRRDGSRGRSADAGVVAGVTFMGIISTVAMSSWISPSVSSASASSSLRPGWVPYSCPASDTALALLKK